MPTIYQILRSIYPTGVTYNQEGTQIALSDYSTSGSLVDEVPTLGFTNLVASRGLYDALGTEHLLTALNDTFTIYEKFTHLI